MAINPAKKPRKILKKSDPSYEQAASQMKQKFAEIYLEFGADPLNKKIFKDLKKNMEKYINAIAPHDPAQYALLEAQYIKLISDYENFLANPKNIEFSKMLSDAFIVFKAEIENC